MKKFSLFVLMLGIFFIQRASAQLKVNLDVNIGSQPVWGPPGYDHAEYYYLPDYDVYYYVPRRQYIYWEGDRRVFAPSLPPRYRNADLYRSYKVVLNEPRAYLHHGEHVRRYAEYRGHREQPVIRDNHEEKYYQIKDHPEHGKWHGDDHGRGNGRGNGRGHGGDHGGGDHGGDGDHH